ncbi:MAG: hypothetical protein HXM21_05850 [Haemophilus influenzae]|nr:hypothetical protein [Haemophilus influenzae]MBF1224371.1 hypothetical protein [Haemophilus parainfluenzae]
MTKTAVHLSDNTWQYITGRTPQGEQKGLSAHINNAFEQLAHLARAEKPELSKTEWVELYNVYAACSDLTHLVMPFDLADDFRTHYGTFPQDLTALYDKLNGMTQAQQFSVLDAVRVYWASGEDGD